MKSFNAHEIIGNWATLLIPINSDESINWPSLSEEIDLLIQAGVNGIYSNGTSGEFYNQTEEEFDKISSLLANKCSSADMPFQLGVSNMSPWISLNRLKRLKIYKPSAFQVILPDWFPLNDREIIVFLKKMSETAAPTGIVLYNPPHAKRVLTPNELLEIVSKVKGIVGIKVADGNGKWYREMTPVFKKISVFVPGHHLATGVLHGALGAYSNVACLNPKGAQKWYNTMLTNMGKALELEARLKLFMDKYISPYITEKKYMNGAVDKFLACIGGWAKIGTKMRWPYDSIPEEDAIKLRAVAHEVIPEIMNP